MTGMKKAERRETMDYRPVARAWLKDFLVNMV